MARGSNASSARMAVDLALAIQLGKIPPGQKLQAQLAQTYRHTVLPCLLSARH
ncbi:hypothetical protein [Streptomyces sp. NPDC059753]|uniref:hypothetical protein n=1 Tax=Streptomyces sp. NPDC059753 TaxID=3346933 RepID=UPI003648BB2A